MAGPDTLHTASVQVAVKALLKVYRHQHQCLS
jgi:hypothetical protein